MSVHKPSHFIVNTKDHSLLIELLKHLEHTKYFDVITGYFRVSGYDKLAKALNGPDKVRILVGLEADNGTSLAVAAAGDVTLSRMMESSYLAKQTYAKEVKATMEASDDSYEVEQGIRNLIHALGQPVHDIEADKQAGGNGKKLEIRLYPKGGLHAKVYIMRNRSGSDLGRVITGSSNVSANGLVHNLEFNVQLKEDDDVSYALHRFEELWHEGVDLQQVLVDTLLKETWLREDILPYHLYLKMLLEYFGAELNSDKEEEFFYFAEGYKSLTYQIDAARDAMRKLEMHGGVFLSDVVGLGKTFITALVLQKLPGKKAIICPPVLRDGWKEALSTFNVTNYEIYSLGKVTDVKTNDLKYVVIDEAHRLRNSNTQVYEELLKICRGKKVILVSATPINNRIDDIQNQIALFQPKRNSTIPGATNYEALFSSWRRELQSASEEVKSAKKTNSETEIVRATMKEKQELERIASLIQDKLLKHLMVRRTRGDINKFYGKDMIKQGLSFPTVMPPERIVYEYRGNVESAFQRTVELLREYNYARYTPTRYLKPEFKSQDSNDRSFGEAAERNLGAFMKGVLVKRLESSFFAFKASLNRFLLSATHFYNMFETGIVYLGDQKKIAEMLEDEDYEKLNAALDGDKIREYKSSDFEESYIPLLYSDIKILEQLKEIWSNIIEDPKLESFQEALKTNNQLKSNKVIIFTESSETGLYLHDKLLGEYKSGVLLYHGSRCLFDGKEEKPNVARSRVTNNFDPRVPVKDQDNDVRILIATDVLAEGVNLHRTNLIVNYDLPWNPTRVLQRVGRINRVGTTHNEIYIYNFFPTSHAEVHLSQEENIQRKLTLFHGILGEDAKYLSENEQIGSRELFVKLNKTTTYEGEDSQESELEYLKEIRAVRDEQPLLFKQISELPIKIRCCYPGSDPNYKGLVTFFRAGHHKKFYWSSGANGQPQELTFFEAVRALKTAPGTLAKSISEEFYGLLEDNKRAFESSKEITHEHIEITKGRTKTGGNTKIGTLKSLLDSYLAHVQDVILTEQLEYINYVKVLNADGALSVRTTNSLIETLKRAEYLNDVHKGYKAIRKLVGGDPKDNRSQSPSISDEPSVIVLSGLII